MAEKHVHKVYGSFPPWGKSVEFPSSGGGGNYVYYSGTMRDFSEGGSMASIIRANKGGDVAFMPSGLFFGMGNNPENIIGAGFDTSMKMTSWDDSSELITVGDVLGEMFNEWTQITEDEFYLKSHFMITNGILNADDSTLPLTFKYDEGMTWREWINSPYNAYGYFIEDQQVIGVFVRKTREGFPESCPIAYSGFDGSVTVTPDEKIEGRGYFIYV